MKPTVRHHDCQLAVIGTGLAGFAAGLFALQRGIRTAQVGNTGALAYTTGYLDLLGVHAGSVLESPWVGLARLREDEPGHPLARLDDGEIRRAFAGFTEALTELGIGYSAPGERNLSAWSPAGTLKPTCSMPSTMLPGVEAGTPGHKALIVGFHGLEGFSADQLVVNLRARRPELTAVRLAFPGMEAHGRLFPEVMARALEVPARRHALADLVQTVLGDAVMVGLPAILGVHEPDRVHADMQRLLGVPVFEIPTMPPGVPGTRLREMFEQRLPERGLQLVPQQKVRRLGLREDGLVLHLQDSFGEVVMRARAALLATGRFLSGGLKADRDGVRETLLDLPVVQPHGRDAWYREAYFDPRGHAINRAGLACDEHFRPLGHDGEPVDGRLFAAGSVLTGQDWMRQRCGAGVAIATAWRAVEAASALLGPLDAGTPGG